MENEDRKILIKKWIQKKITIKQYFKRERKKGKSSFKFHDAAIIGAFHVSVDRVAVLGTSSSSVFIFLQFLLELFIEYDWQQNKQQKTFKTDDFLLIVLAARLMTEAT